MYIMAGLLAVAFFANLGIKPVAERYVERMEPAPKPKNEPALA